MPVEPVLIGEDGADEERGPDARDRDLDAHARHDPLGPSLPVHR